MDLRASVLRGALRPGQWNQLRSVAQLNVKSTQDNHNEMWENARPVTEIPGPTKFQFILGNLFGGGYSKMPYDKLFENVRKIYGDTFMMPGILGKKSVLFSFNPDDYPTVLRSEGIWPYRIGLETMTYHRTVHRTENFGDVIGLLGSNGEAWGKIRSTVNPVLMQPRTARLYINKMLEVNDEFLQRIREIRDPNTLEVPENFEDEMNRFTFETVAVVALNQQIGLINKRRNEDEVKILFESLRNVFQLSLELDFQPSFWKIVKTPKFHKIMKSYDTMYAITMKYINQALERMEKEQSAKTDDEEQSVLEKLVKIDKKVAVVMAMDMLTAGVDTTSSTLTGILLCIAKNPEKQQILREEMRTILPEKDSKLTIESMKNLPYLRACIKEGMRLYPIGVGTLRSAGEDIVVSGYQVPKQQLIAVCSNLLMMEEKYVPKPKEFIPERWLRSENNDLAVANAFLNIPFGHGPRSCVGKRIVEMELEIAVARLVRNFYIEFNYSTENAFKNRLINVPAIPLKFKLSDVEN